MLLTAFIEKLFGEYGDCWACVFRNPRKEEDSPHAIVQYTVSPLHSADHVSKKS